jgi:hypothetical protein
MPLHHGGYPEHHPNYVAPNQAPEPSSLAHYRPQIHRGVGFTMRDLTPDEIAKSAAFTDRGGGWSTTEEAIQDALITNACAMAGLEVRHAMKKHKAMNSLHEAYAVIMEEIEEFWEQVMRKTSERDMDNVRMELRQIAAMAIRATVELT